MNMDDIKLFTKNENELEILIHTIQICDQYTGGIRQIKCTMLIMRSGK